MALAPLDVTRLPDGMHADGQGLFLQVRGRSRSWILRYTLGGKSKYLGLGSVKDVSLKQARLDAGAKRRQIDDARKGERGAVDPVEERKQARQALQAAKTTVTVKTFKQAAEAYLEVNKTKWLNAKHRWQWGQTLERAYAVFGTVPVADVTRAHVLELLRPIWRTIPETARRLRGRIETVLDFAEANEWRPADNNPARQKPVSMALGDQDAMVEPHPSLPYERMGEFMGDLRRRSTLSAYALELQILCATRPGRETLDAEWREIDWEARTWTIPKQRMLKGRRRKGAWHDHVVPLSPAALTLLRKLYDQRSGDAIFGIGLAAVEKLVRTMNADRSKQGLSRFVDPKQDNRPVVPHGFRSSFSTWRRDATSFSSELGELALAHAIGSDVERAYQRGDARDRRRDLMNSWAMHLGPVLAGNVVQMPQRG